MSEDKTIKNNIVNCFYFKSKTLDGRAAKIIVTVYDNGVICIIKRLTSTDDLTVYGLKLIKKYKRFGIYEEQISLFERSLLSIMYGIEHNIGK